MMIDALMKKASLVSDSDDGYVGDRHHGGAKSKAAIIVDGLVQLTTKRSLRWVVSDKKDFALSVSAHWMFIIIKYPVNHQSRYITGTADTYTVIIFHANKEFLRFSSTCDNPAYDTHSKRFPAMDLYDFVTEGAFRRPHTAHVCGLQGFGYSLDDMCPACEEARESRHTA